MSGLSYSTSQYDIDPSSSPMPDSRIWVRRGEIVVQEGQYDAVQNVRRGMLELVESNRFVRKASGLRTLECVSRLMFLYMTGRLWNGDMW